MLLINTLTRLYNRSKALGFYTLRIVLMYGLQEYT